MATRFLRPKDVPVHHPGITVKKVYRWIGESSPVVQILPGGEEAVLSPGNGFAQCFRRDGRSVLIDEEAMIKWIREALS
jgi:hypothetical protein